MLRCGFRQPNQGPQYCHRALAGTRAGTCLRRDPNPVRLNFLTAFDGVQSGSDKSGLIAERRQTDIRQAADDL